MKVKLEIPAEDFTNMINAIQEKLTKEGLSFACYNARNQIIEEGGYSFQFQVEKGYSHDLGKLTDCAKIVITIDTIPPQ